MVSLAAQKIDGRGIVEPVNAGFARLFATAVDWDIHLELDEWRQVVGQLFDVIE